jgi:hypothetical protein
VRYDSRQPDRADLDHVALLYATPLALVGSGILTLVTGVVMLVLARRRTRPRLSRSGLYA